MRPTVLALLALVMLAAPVLADAQWSDREGDESTRLGVLAVGTGPVRCHASAVDIVAASRADDDGTIRVTATLADLRGVTATCATAAGSLEGAVDRVSYRAYLMEPDPLVEGSYQSVYTLILQRTPGGVAGCGYGPNGPNGRTCVGDVTVSGDTLGIVIPTSGDGWTIDASNVAFEFSTEAPIAAFGTVAVLDAFYEGAFS